MPASEFSTSPVIARATSGQRLVIGYDQRTNAIVFVEDDWTADIRRGASPRTAFREELDTKVIRRLRRRAAPERLI